MSDPELRVVDLSGWVERARHDPMAYVERQATWILLSAIGSLPEQGARIFLKGGILMALFYGSPRSTADIDFTTDLPATHETVEALSAAIDAALPRAAARLGFADLVLRVQTTKERPKAFDSGMVSRPDMKMTIAYAKRGSPEEKRLRNGQGPHVLDLEISFNEPVRAIEIARLGTTGLTFSAYGLTDLIAEKLRALLQQASRNRGRRQDIYDIAHLAQRFQLDEAERAEVLASLRVKSAARGITPTVASISEPQVRARAQAEWDTLRQELGELPDFDACFAMVESLYRSLPWGR